MLSLKRCVSKNPRQIFMLRLRERCWPPISCQVRAATGSHTTAMLSDGRLRKVEDFMREESRVRSESGRNWRQWSESFRSSLLIKSDGL